MARTLHVFVVLLGAYSIALCQAGTSSSLRVIVHDADNNPVPGVQVVVSSAKSVQLGGVTGASGVAEFPLNTAGVYRVSISKNGSQEQTAGVVVVVEGQPTEVRFTQIPKITDLQQVSVSGTPDDPLEVGASPGQQLQGDELRRLPLKPLTVADALPLVPGVIRTPDGQIEIAGTSEAHSAMLVNSLNVTDPQTGQFGITVPTESVQSVGVYTTPFVANHGGFSAGLVSVETKRGGEKWHFGIEDPLPEFRIRSGHLVGLRSASPTITFGGPVEANRLYSLTSIAIVIDKRPVRTLPFPFNETRQQSVNLFTQFDYLISATHTLSTTLHVAPQSAKYLNLDFFNPRPVTPNLGSTDESIGFIDRNNVSWGVLQSAAGYKSKDSSTTSQGGAAMVLSPTGNRGNYFSSQDRVSRRYELREDFAISPVKARGTHHIIIGGSASLSATDGRFAARPVAILDSSGVLRRRIDFRGGQPYARTDLELAPFVQDHWELGRFSIDLGTRIEKQRLTDAFRVAPRIGFAVNPLRRFETTFRGGLGIFYDSVPLSPYIFGNYPQQEITTFDSTGRLIIGPTLFANVVGGSGAPCLPFCDGEAQPGSFVPSSIAWKLEIEQPVFSQLKVRASYSQSNSRGLLILNRGRINSTEALILNGTGRSVYHQFELTSELKFKDGRRLFLSYVHSRARGNLNQFGGYLGDLPQPIVQSTQFTNLDGCVPNRFLAWGTVRVPFKLDLSPTVEARSGFPYAVTNVLQDYVGIPNSDNTRFPRFFSIDARISRDFAVNPKYGVRLSLTGFNLTNHFNALAVHSNMADPGFRHFFGTYNRRFRFDFDVLF